MFAFWWAWRSLHVGERLLLVVSLLLMTFCAGASWQNYHHRSSSKTLLQESPQAKLIHWNSSASIIVDVSGEVRHPGIVQLPRDSRVRDAIEKAGGVLPSANLSKLNLAATLTDGQQVQIDSTSSKSTFTADKSSGAKININQASEAELESLPNIGPVMAARIMEYRRSHGAIENVDELNAVKGIGVKTIEKIQPYIVFH